MTLKRTQVIMLPTNEKSNALWWSGQNLYNKPPEDYSRGELNHLYFLSDEEIKEGDWCIMLDSFGNVFSNPQQYLGKAKGHYINKGTRKIIATTDSSLTVEKVDGFLSKDSPTGKLLDYLPQPSQEFIEKYIEEYNKNNIITDVLIEYNICSPGMCLINDMTCGHSGCKNTNPKVNSNNEIL